MAEEMAVSAAILVAGPFCPTAPKCALSALHRIASPAHVVGTELVVAASRSLRPFVGFSRVLGAINVSAHRAHTSGLASCADVWDSATTAWKKRAKKLNTHQAETSFSSARTAKVTYATHAMTVGNHAVHVVESFASFVKKMKSAKVVLISVSHGAVIMISVFSSLAPVMK
ncbi:hypothetical protein EDB19DRAFT_95999 [Suillus lakei]|nr:hypothetical protein EDB19DRAFT_95999 [Suillus lakei]